MDSQVSLERELLTEPNQHQLDTVPQRALVTKLYFAGFLKTEGEDFERDHTFQKVDPLKVKEKDNKSSVFRPQKMPKKNGQRTGAHHLQGPGFTQEEFCIPTWKRAELSQ